MKKKKKNNANKSGYEYKADSADNMIIFWMEDN
jgi:hypothetical protein